ncbi:MAG: DUF362 domain-containing protein [Acidobacteriota bacterium]
MKSLREKVSINGCPAYSLKDVRQSIVKGLEPFGGIDSFVKSGDRVLIKPNMLIAKCQEDAVTTHPVIIEAVIELVKESGGKPCVGDSPGFGSMERVARKSGISNVCQKRDVRMIDFDASGTERVGKEGIFRNIRVARAALDTDKIINIPKIKTHAQMVLTMGVKNLFGCVVGKEKARWHFNAGNNRLFFARLLVEIYRAIQPALTISDAVVVMEGNGPSAGKPRRIGIIGCAKDAVAHDAVFSSILGLGANNLPVIEAASEMHAWTHSLNDIEVISEKSLEELTLKDFEFPPTVDIMFNFPRPVQRLVRNSITSKPVINHERCTKCMKCVDICPPGVMAKVNSLIEIDYGDCISCFCCQEICPEGAITPREGWLSRLIP